MQTLRQEIFESRMFRTVEAAAGLSTEDLTTRIFEHFLALQILSYEDPHKAKTYAGDMMNGANFTNFRSTQTDLYNLIVLLLHNDYYEKYIKDKLDIKLPEAIIRRNIRGIAAGDIDSDDFNKMMLILQRLFTNLNGNLINLRREISNWPNLSKTSRRVALDFLILTMRERAHWNNSDLYILLKTID